MIVTSSQFGANHPDFIGALAARHKLPAVYPYRYFVNAGGLMSYGSDLLDDFRRAAGYIDRILRGEKPANLPVQAPTRYQLVIKAAAVPVGMSWMWTLAFGYHEDRTPTHGYEATREAAMAAFAKSWRRG